MLILSPLFRSITSLKGVGEKQSEFFSRLTGGKRIIDLLYHFPVDFIDRSFSPKISQLLESEIYSGKVITKILRVEQHSSGVGKSKPYKVLCSDDSGFMNLVFFNASKKWLEQKLPVGKQVIISGKTDFFQEKPQIVHPDYIEIFENKDHDDNIFKFLDKIEPVYPLTAGITNRLIRKTLKTIDPMIPDLPEWLDPALMHRENWTSWKNSLRKIHCLGSDNDDYSCNTDSPYRKRLAYDELLANQLALAVMRNREEKNKGRSFKGNGTIRSKLMSELPFSLTLAQEKVIAEIDRDIHSENKMTRLLQGDVGSGKTIVALLAMTNALENSAQCVIMAPTEILARQHAKSLSKFFKNTEIEFVTLTGRNKGKEREGILEKIRNGQAKIIIGTHTLFQEQVEFDNLGFVVIDEQHRFGVHQRLRLSDKGKNPDLLVMSATPIPRTLAMTIYGDMEVSRIDEKPPSRKPIDTRLIPLSKIEEMLDGIERQIAKGQRVYWVCPLVEESEKLELAAAMERYEIIKSKLGEKVGLVHGKMKPAEKDEIMNKFAIGEISVLVSTTVIEVGVDVPQATIMVIEHAERFGLAQLHQLRGRVGRGSGQSFCFLIYGNSLSETAKERLAIMKKTEDGFLIAEKDLELRGGGEVLGVRQSGFPVFKSALLPEDFDLLKTANTEAKLIVNIDPNLEKERAKNLRILLYLFERDRAVKYLGL